MITFNNTRIDDNGWTIKALNRSASPTLSANSYTVSGVAGSIFQSRTIGEREFSVTLQCIARTIEEMHQKIGAMVEILDTNEPKKLQFSDRPDGYYLAIAQGTWTLDQSMRYVAFTITFKMHDPYFYLNSPVTTTHETTSGVVSNAQGKYHNWQISIQANTSLSKIECVVGDTKIVLNGNFVNGDVVTITNMGVVKINDVSRPHLLSLDSRLYPLAQGDNKYTLTSGAQMQVQIHGKKLY